MSLDGKPIAGQVPVQFFHLNIESYKNYEDLKPIFDKQVNHLKCPDGSFYWDLPMGAALGALVIFEDSKRGISYMTRIWGIEPSTDEQIKTLGPVCMLCRKV